MAAAGLAVMGAPCRCRHGRQGRALRGGTLPTTPAVGKLGRHRTSARVSAGLFLRGYRSRMRLATWNVNSVKQRVPRLLPWLDQRQPDVVCLQETKLTD